MNKKCKIVIVFVFLFQMGLCNAYSSIQRVPWTSIIHFDHFSAYHIGIFSEYATDSTIVFDILKSSEKGLKKWTVNHKWCRTLEKNSFYFFMTSDSTDFVFGWYIKDKREAYKTFNKAKEIDKIFTLTDIDLKVRKYINWRLSLCKSKYQRLKIEGFFEWGSHGGGIMIYEYFKKYGLEALDEDGHLMQENWDRVLTEKDKRNIFDILLKTDYPSYQEWAILLSFCHQYTSEVKTYTYNFLKRYAENFDKNLDDIQSKKIQCYMAFTILNRIETNEKILEILSGFDKDDNWYYPYQERRILESYINPIIKQADK